MRGDKGYNDVTSYGRLWKEGYLKTSFAVSYEIRPVRIKTAFCPVEPSNVTDLDSSHSTTSYD